MSLASCGRTLYAPASVCHHCVCSCVTSLSHPQLFSTIAELFEEPNVVGVTMAIRSKNDMLSIWNKDNFNADVRFLIRCVLRFGCCACAVFH